MTDHDPMCPAANDRFRPLLHVCTCKALREPAAAYVCNPEDGHHWVSQLSQEHIWVQTCSMCSQIRLDLDDHDAQVRADERQLVGRVWAKREDLLLGDIEVARADERERILAELEGPARESEAMYAHAEAVAARLVEVICEQDDLIQIVGVDATNHRAAAADMRRERDAARAAVLALLDKANAKVDKDDAS